MKAKTAALLAALLSGAAALAAPAPPPPQFSGETTLASLNLAMPAMRNAKQVPAKPVPVGTYPSLFTHPPAATLQLILFISFVIKQYHCNKA